jgi:hypothetical protein
MHQGIRAELNRKSLNLTDLGTDLEDSSFRVPGLGPVHNLGRGRNLDQILVERSRRGSKVHWADGPGEFRCTRHNELVQAG